MECKQIEYTSFHPQTRDEIRTFVADHVKFDKPAGITLINSGTGSGKTQIMIDFANNKTFDCCFVISPNQVLKDQTKQVFRDSRWKNETLLLDISDVDIATILNHVLSNNNKKKVTIFVSGIGHRTGDFNKLTIKLLDLITDLNEVGIKSMAIFDEFDQQFTYINGGAQIRTEINKTNLNLYKKFQTTSALNICSQLRMLDVHVIGLSATLNNIICSKMPLLKYIRKKIKIINIYPIKDLYSNVRIQSIDTSDFDNLVPYLETAERETDKKILLIFPDTAYIKSFKSWYKNRFTKEISCAEFVSQNKEERMSSSFERKLNGSKYVIGINMLCTGFNISSHVENVEFNLGILFRKLSDKTTNPLSSNQYSDLYCQESAKLIQSISRLRKGGTFLIPASFNDVTSLYDIQHKISEIIEKGYEESNKIGPFHKSQLDRYYQTLHLAILQNIRESSDRSAIDTIIRDLEKIHGRNLKIEHKRKYIDLVESEKAPEYDCEFWTKAIKEYWERQYRLHFGNEDTQLQAPNVIIDDAIKPDASQDKLCVSTTISNGRVGSASNKHCHPETEVENVDDLESTSDDDETEVENVEDHHSISDDEETEVENVDDLESISDDDETEVENVDDLESISDDDEETEVENVDDLESISDDDDLQNPPTILTIHETGNGERKPRLVDEDVKKRVIKRACGICAHCSDPFIEGEDAQISHIRRFDDGGKYTEDNLVFTHKECDSIFDSGKIVLDINGGFWVSKKYKSHRIDFQQYCHISQENIRTRWNWEKKTPKWDEKLSNDNEFRILLMKRKYTFCYTYTM